MLLTLQLLFPGNERLVTTISLLSSDEYPTYADATNFSDLRSLAKRYELHRLQDAGKWNADKKEVEYDPSRVTSNKAPSSAMGYAVDTTQLARSSGQRIAYTCQHHYSTCLLRATTMVLSKVTPTNQKNLSKFRSMLVSSTKTVTAL